MALPLVGQAMNWEKVPSASEKNCQSKAWFTVKKDSIHIKTKIFSFWSVFACGGPKRKRATVFVSQPSPHNDLLYLRFYIYSDNEDSRKVGEKENNSPRRLQLRVTETLIVFVSRQATLFHFSSPFCSTGDAYFKFSLSAALKPATRSWKSRPTHLHTTFS